LGEVNVVEEKAARRFGIRTLIAAIVLAALGTVALVALLTNIFERQQEARNPFYRVVELNDTIVDASIWGKNFPLQYDDYLRTVDQVRTRYGGSEAMPRDPTSDDPRTVTSQSRLEEDPRLREFWSGYAFAEDFREERGHAYVLEDQLFTRRQQVTQQPGTCLHCHASMYVAYMQAGNGDLIKGFEAINPLPYADAVKRAGAKHPVSCIDCHNPQTMALRVTRPGFIEGIRALRASEGIQDFDVNKSATRQQMRTFVCAQCHVEYYFKGKEKRLTYPWAKGLKADSILAYYEENGHKDFTHAVSGAPVLKAQHPEFELYSQGIHARSGVACADCHMPYKRTGAMKISDHHVRSPLLNIDKACQTCHHSSQEELREKVHTIQDRTYEMRNIAIEAVLQLTRAIGTQKADSMNPRVRSAQAYQRKAQFLTDFIEAENSMGFHADQESARILANAINYARLGQSALRGEVLANIPRPAPPQQIVSPGKAPDH
jgi:nitrite reductase (cytochrome c-552)